MTDRIVRQVAPKPDDANQRKLFSEFSARPNLVLLGAPGAGKTHLFTEAAAGNGTRVTTRDFLNIPSFPSDVALFIDALDERRAGRGDQGTIDAVVRKLFEVKPKKVRISCRESDWLGETDLAAFQPYFDQSGGCVVLTLEQLTLDEQCAVLTAQGTLDPNEFLKQARERDLEDLLVNPQNLLMLAKVVVGENWPRHRTELFEKATEILLSEHNPSRSRAGDGVYGPHELRGPAGAVLAARLISDVGGVSLTENQVNDDYPSYRTSPFQNLEKVRAALGRRVFIGNGNEAADYTHRTTAEYLGAQWLAQQIASGLPIGRIRALIGVDGHPTPELRGLHAWLAVLCPAHANELIDADPYGVLTYGDAATLRPSHRKRLLATLAQLSETDPWFGREDRTAPNLGALASTDLAKNFQHILRSKEANFALKKLVLGALAAGSAFPGLHKELLGFFLNAKEPYTLRSLAFETLKKSGLPGVAAIKKAYRKLGKSDSDIRLRAEVIRGLYEEFTATEVTNILNDALECKTDLPGGVLWYVAQTVSTRDIPAIFAGVDMRDRVVDPDTRAARAERHNAHDVSSALARFLLRFLQESTAPISAASLWKMLSIHAALGGLHAGSEGVQKELSQHPELLRALFEEAMDELGTDSLDYGALWRFREATMQSADENLVAQWMAERAQSAKDPPTKQAFVYQMAIGLAISATNPALFDQLYAFGETRSDLASVRALNVASVIEDWRRQSAARRVKRQADVEMSTADTLQMFSRDQDRIRRAEDPGWLTWLAKIYLDPNEGSEDDVSPRVKLERRIGANNVPIALAGLRAALGRNDIPSVKDVGRAVVKNSYPYSWYVPIASMDERWSVQPKLSGLSDDLLRRLIAIKLVMHTERRVENVVSQREHAWLTTALHERLDLVTSVYHQIVSMALEKNVKIISGLYELLNDEAFVSVRQDIVLRLLSKFPAAPIEHLEQLLKVAVSLPEIGPQLNKLAETALGKGQKLDRIQRELWLSAAYLINPTTYVGAFRRAAHKPGIIWQLRSLQSTQRRRNFSDLSIDQLETIIKAAAQHFPQVPHQSGWGDTNPWDGSQYIHALINHVSSLATKDAATLLKRLVHLASLTTYQDLIKHAISNQSARLRELEYQQPDWQRTVSALLNGAPANHADLQALVLDHCRDLNNEITNRNIDVYKQFWNEKSHGRISSPRSEETSRDILVGMLRTRLHPLNITVEPEGHMAADKRVDVSVALDHRKTMMEWKRDYHPDVWHAYETQLDRLYTPDPDASGYGIYGIFWFGSRRPRKMPARPDGGPQPQSAAEMRQILSEMISPEKRERLGVIVLDLSGPPTSRAPSGKKLVKKFKKSAAKKTKSKIARRSKKKLVGKRSGHY
ncbi:hypothetical protein [Bradyrhizobium sp. OAE829]|uniref:hypothetical protein n=1 Tax=Bradyrhizobium sp. OAE829 TaxID=2663807 RepID=UPI00178B643A